MHALVKLLSGAVASQKNFKAFALFVKATPDQLKALNQAEKADNVGLCTLKGATDEAMGLYKVSPAVKNTVFVYKDREVKYKFVNFDAKKDAARLQSAIAAVCK